MFYNKNLSINVPKNALLLQKNPKNCRCMASGFVHRSLTFVGNFLTKRLIRGLETSAGTSKFLFYPLSDARWLRD